MAVAAPTARRHVALGVLAVLVLASCADPDDTGGATPDGTSEPAPDDTGGATPDGTSEPAPDDTGGTAPGVTSETAPAETADRYVHPDAPSTPAADEPNPEAAARIDAINDGFRERRFDFLAISELGQLGDPRHAWYVTDLLRFYGAGDEGRTIVTAFEQLTGVSLADDPESADNVWRSASNHMIAWDTPAHPGYREDKAGIFLLVEPAWEPFFEDPDSAIDWRHVTWGGVPIDDRELGDPDPCPGGCIPALDDPAVTDAAGGAWYGDEQIVFGIVEGDEALAIPLNIAEVHEMFNLTLGGRRLAVPYCTLCGSAQAYYTDDTAADEVPVLRTSGLLSRSNKVMYDLRTWSVFDTFTGDAVSGPLQDLGVTLEQTTVVRSTWGEWRAEHPDTTIIAEDGGIGRTYPDDPLGGRDDDGPIFAIGEADDRLPVQELVVGVLREDGGAVAFPSDQASRALAGGDPVEEGGVRLEAAGDGLVATDAATGERLAAHEAFWFAWSQFHPDTSLWEPRPS